jgi:hypothetical protein
VRVLELIAIGVFVLLACLGLLFLRRGIISRGGGTIELSWRLSTIVSGRGWSPGLGRFTGDELRWYRMFSLSVRPKRTLSRRTLAVESRRVPDGPERFALAPDWIVVRCTSGDTPLEIAMAEPALAGFLSWIEAVPPGTVSARIAAR